jgi:shikimate kinase
MPPLLVIVGPPGAGKSTVGEILARRLGADFRDTDDDVERAAGMTVADIFLERGEAAFRELERAAVRQALADHYGVLALGGGAILAGETRAALAGHTVVYLSVELADAVKRIGLGQGRPLLTVNPRATLKYLMDQRRPFYAAVATVTVATDGRTPDEVAAEVLAALST